MVIQFKNRNVVLNSITSYLDVHINEKNTKFMEIERIFKRKYGKC